MSKKNLLISLLLICSFALIFAYISQYIFGYQPCILCLYQRKPFFAVIALSALALFFFKKEKFQKFAIFFSIIFLAINAGIAFYHVGVEQKIFKGPSTCASQSLDGIDNLEELAAAISSTKAVRCDEPQFFFLKLSMAAWNLLFCVGLVMATIYLYRSRA